MQTKNQRKRDLARLRRFENGKHYWHVQCSSARLIADLDDDPVFTFQSEQFLASCAREATDQFRAKYEVMAGHSVNATACRRR